MSSRFRDAAGGGRSARGASRAIAMAGRAVSMAVALTTVLLMGASASAGAPWTRTARSATGSGTCWPG